MHGYSTLDRDKPGDPRSLGEKERAAFELGLSKSQAAALQQVAFDGLSETKATGTLMPFNPVGLTK